MNDAIILLRNRNVVKEAASKLRIALLGVNFGQEDKFCDAEELMTSWKSTKMPDDLVPFFCQLTNANKTSFLHSYFNIDSLEEPNGNETDDFVDENNRMKFKVTVFNSIFQVLFYNMHKGKKQTPLHIMTAAEIYEKCKSRELITSFNRSGLCISYNAMKRHRQNLAKYAVHRSQPSGIPVPSHFSLDEFTVAAFDNFDHDDKSTLSGLNSSHDTAITLFQVKPEQPVTKPMKSEVPLSTISLSERLPCQEVVPFNSNRVLLIPSEFEVSSELYHSEQYIERKE